MSLLTGTGRPAAASAQERLYYRDARVQLFGQAAARCLALLSAASLEADITDPPYHLLAKGHG